MLTVETVTAFNNDVLNDILMINKISFPLEWEYKDSRSYYQKRLMDKKDINIILKNNGSRIGYLLAIPHNEAVAELKGDDPQMEEDKNTYYVETVGILPEFRGHGGASILFDTLLEECNRRGAYKISMHARVINGFSSFIQRKFNILNMRRIERWKYYNFEEPTDYIEASFGASRKC